MEIIGLDINKNALEKAKTLKPMVRFMNESILNLPFEDNTVPLIICSKVLEHIEDHFKAVSEILRVSSIGFILTVPNEPLFILSNLTSLNHLRNFGNALGHINHWHMKSFVNYFI
ncbi:MAG: class I SAM-dependent methyltransferase [Candidatus Hodarchaeota archaeon]